MTRLRLLPLSLGAGMALLVAPGAASAAPSSDPVQLLERASVAGRSLTYDGLQFTSSWGADSSSTTVADLQHTARGGSVVVARPTAFAAAESTSLALAPPVAATTELDPRLLRLLTVHYQLELGATEPWAGRTASVVQARRLDTSLAGRFWIDTATGLLVRREAYDSVGRLVRSSALTTLTVRDRERSPLLAKGSGPAPGMLSDTELAAKADWPLPRSLPGGLDLFDARMSTHDDKQVLHLSYSDGLSTVSVFAQPGRLGSEPPSGAREQEVAGAPVWVTSGTPQRMVWSGAGQVFTLLSDAPAEAVSAAVSGLPHEPEPDNGVLARIGRGISRVLSWLNPFD